MSKKKEKTLFSIREADYGIGVRWYVQNGGSISIGYATFPEAVAAALISLRATSDSLQ